MHNVVVGACTCCLHGRQKTRRCMCRSPHIPRVQRDMYVTVERFRFGEGASGRLFGGRKCGGMGCVLREDLWDDLSPEKSSDRCRRQTRRREAHGRRRGAAARHTARRHALYKVIYLYFQNPDVPRVMEGSTHPTPDWAETGEVPGKRCWAAKAPPPFALTAQDSVYPVRQTATHGGGHCAGGMPNCGASRVLSAVSCVAVPVDCRATCVLGIAAHAGSASGTLYNYTETVGLRGGCVVQGY